MPELRVERLPVQAFGLGILGFDHLQLVFEPYERSAAVVQDRWLVIEGLREPDARGVRLGVEGSDGATTLSEANGGATGENLVAKIGTTEARGGRILAAGREATVAWATLTSYAVDMETQRFPYIAYSLEGSPLPTINSSSLVSSLLFHAGYDLSLNMPFGLRFSPGTATLLGTSREDRLELKSGPFTTVLSGAGSDDVAGSDEPDRVDKLYGGSGDDVLHWSTGFNILHGGQPSLDYVDDGYDRVDYAGAGEVLIEAGAAPIEHYRPDFVVRHGSVVARESGGEAPLTAGVDYLLSIEELKWDDRSDTVILGRGVGLSSASLSLDLGAGDDIVDGSAAGFSSHIDAGPGNDWIVAGTAPMISRGGSGADTFVVADRTSDLTIEDASPDDHLLFDWEYAELHADRQQSGDVFLEVRGTHDERALIRIERFEAGALGLYLGDDDTVAFGGRRSYGPGLLLDQHDAWAGETSKAQGDRVGIRDALDMDGSGQGSALFTDVAFDVLSPISIHAPSSDDPRHD